MLQPRTTGRSASLAVTRRTGTAGCSCRRQQVRRVISGSTGDDHGTSAVLFLHTKMCGVSAAAGGSIALPGGEARQLQWHLQTHSSSVLSLSEVSLTRGQIGRGLQLHIQDQVFPAVAAQIDSSSQRLWLCLVLASKAVAVLTLPLGAGSTAQQASGSSSPSILDRLGQGGTGEAAGWHVVQAGAQLSAVGLPSALAIADGHLCVAGSSGSTACISMPVLAYEALQELPPDAQGSGAAFSLDPSGLVAQVKRRIGWAASSPAVSAVAVDLPAAQHHSLLVVHEDSSCHQWLVGQHRQGMSLPLAAATQGKPARPHKVCVCYPQPGGRSIHWDALLVFDLGLSDRGAQSDVRVLPVRLQREQDQSAAAARLEPLLQQPVQLQLEWPDASLVDAKVAGQQLLVLCSTTSGAGFVVSYAVKDWSYQGPCQLLQQKGGNWGSQQVGAQGCLAAAVATDLQQAGARVFGDFAGSLTQLHASVARIGCFPVVTAPRLCCLLPTAGGVGCSTGGFP